MSLIARLRPGRIWPARTDMAPGAMIDSLEPAALSRRTFLRTTSGAIAGRQILEEPLG